MCWKIKSVHLTQLLGSQSVHQNTYQGLSSPVAAWTKIYLFIIYTGWWHTLMHEERPWELEVSASNDEGI